MNRIWTRLIVVPIISLLLPYQAFAASPDYSTQSNQQTSSTVISPIESQKITDATNAVTLAQNDPSQQTISIALGLVNDLTDASTKRTLYDKLATTIYGLKDTTLRNDLLLSEVTGTVAFAKSTQLPADVNFALSLVEAIPPSDSRTDFYKQLRDLQVLIVKEHGHNVSVGVGFDSTVLDKAWLDLSNPNNPGNNTDPVDKYLPGYPKDKYEGKGSGGSGSGGSQDPFIVGNQRIRYEVQNGECYKISVYYDDNRVLDRSKPITRTKASSEEAAFCSYSNGTNYNGGNYTNLSNFSGSGYSYQLPSQTVDEESKLTLQYTLDKEAESPNYVDTGIRIAKDNTITYEQEKKALYQTATKDGGKFVEDEGKSLALLEGKIMVVDDQSKDVNVSDFENRFENFQKVEIRALDTRIGSEYCLVDYIEIRGLDTVLVNKAEIKLESKPLIINSRVLFPVKPIAEALGATVVEDGDTITVQKDGHSTQFTVNNAYAKVSGKSVELGVPAKRNSKGVIMAQIQPMLDAFGSHMVWDTQDKVMTIQTN